MGRERLEELVPHTLLRASGHGAVDLGKDFLVEVGINVVSHLEDTVSDIGANHSDAAVGVLALEDRFRI